MVKFVPRQNRKQCGKKKKCWLPAPPPFPRLFSKRVLNEKVALLTVNSLPNDEILDLSKFKGFADDKIILTQNLKFVLGRVENTVGKGENAGYQHFLLFPQCFQKCFFSHRF